MKNVKVIDEHSIDRNASIICSIDVDGSDYVVYSIERDNENDNVFVSKLVKNNDGTSNMMNIEDAIEKTKLDEIVKELITHAINSDTDKTTDSITLSSGKVVNVSTVMFNKDQNINVNKTYISTVKKSVTKVSEMFYKVDARVNQEPEIESIFEDNKEKEVVPETPLPEIDQTSEVSEMPEVPVEEPVIADETPAPEVSVVAEPIPEPTVVPEMPVSEVQSVDESAKMNIVEGPETLINPVVPEPTPVVTEVPELPKAEVVSEPIVTPPVAETPEVVIQPAIPTQENSPLVFDASKETNLNVALGEVSADKEIKVNDVESIREFGVDEPVPVQEKTEPVVSEGKVRTRAMGFANNKFFVVIAVVFFMAACVFLGYEVYRYFTLVK